MSRDFTAIFTQIWTHDDDFRALSGAEQRLYLLLVTQGDITSCGVLALQARRWSRMCSDGDPDEVMKHLERLAQERFVVVDWDEEQVLVRTFIRWDKGYRNSKRLQLIERSARDVRSPVIREALAAEFRYCGLRPIEAYEPEPDGQLPIDVPDDLQDLYPQVDSLSEDSGCPISESDMAYTAKRDRPRVVVSSSRVVGSRSLKALSEEDRFEEFYQAYPRHRGRAAAERKWVVALKAGADPDGLIEAAQRYAEEVKGKDAQYVAHPATWLHQRRWEDEPDRPAVRSRPKSRSEQWLDMIEEDDHGTR